MRHILIAGGMALVCLSFGFSTKAADRSAESYYAEQSPGDADDASVSDEGSLLFRPDACGSCGCSCDGCDCECYDCCDCFNDRQRFLGLLPSDHCFDRFISPLSNPFYFEDPRSLTEMRGIFLDNSLPNYLTGGDAQVFAGQLRGRITDRVSIIAMRLGHLQVNQASGGPPEGFLSAPVGFKYNFIRDAQRQLLVTAGMTYFIKGAGGALANFGSGDFNFFLTGGKQIFGDGHWLSGMGFRIPANDNWGTQMWYWSNQWDYELFNGIYVLGGVNWFHWMRSANFDVGAPVTGLDLLNLPVSGVAGKNVVTGVVGVKLKPSRHCEIGTGFEFPLTDRTDILKNRVYADLIFRY